jgi:CRP-like cAMP-binding protein
VAQSPNRLLSLLSPKSFAALQPHLKLVELSHGTVLGEAGSEITHVYFPHSGVISLVVELDAGDMIETAMVGCDGVLNAAAALDGQITLNKAIVQLAGVASVLPTARLRSFCDENKAFQSLLIRHDQVLFAQSQQSAACNASHSVEARMCRWLLRMRDLTESDDLLLTQEFLAQMLGVRRPSVSIVANTLQKAGLIRYRRGHIRVLDLAGLQEGSCECYATVKAHYDGLLSNRK